MAKKSAAPMCCSSSKAWLPILMLVFGFLWLGNDVNLWALNLPYLPIVVILLALTMMMHHDK